MEAGTNHMFCGLEGSKQRVRQQGNRTYSGAKCSIVESWFPVNANCFVKCICTQRIKYSWTCILIRELGYENPRLLSLSEKNATTQRKEQVRTCNNAGRLAIASATRFLNRLSSCCLAGHLLYADWSLTKSRTRLIRQFYSSRHQIVCFKVTAKLCNVAARRAEPKRVKVAHNTQRSKASNAVLLT
jgi:hypothetical protein